MADAAERRRHVRIAAKGAIVLRGGGYEQRCRLANLAEGGCCVSTSVAVPHRLLGRVVELELRLDTGHAEWLSTSGRVVRIRATDVAIAFDRVPAPLLRLIDELVTASRARLRVISVVLIDADEHRRSAMATGFRATGCTVIEAGTPLEAIVRLGEASFEPDVIAVADSQPGDAADEMRGFVEREHPGAKLITINEDALEPAGPAHWLSSLDPDGDLAARVRATLLAPRRRR